MKRKIGTCALCKQEKQLCRSHIFPESFYKPVYSNGIRKFITLSTDTQKPIKLMQKGMREFLMCQDCDQKIIGKYDNYIASWLYERSIPRPKELKFSFLFDGIDYPLMKLFMLSLLWRFHISQDPCFNAIDLGESAETLRRMLMNENPGDQTCFPCLLIKPHAMPFDLAGGIMCPVLTNTDQMPCCRVIAVGMVWIWILLPNASLFPLSCFAASPTGCLHIIKGIPEITNNMLNDFVQINRASASQPNAEKLEKWGFSSSPKMR